MKAQTIKRSLTSLLSPPAKTGCTGDGFARLLLWLRQNRNLTSACPRRHAISARPLWYRSLRSAYPTGGGGSPSAPWSSRPPLIASGLLAQARGLQILSALLAKVTVALLPAAVLLVAASWAISTPGAALYLQAALWAGGFVLVGLAVDAAGPRKAAAYLVSGIAVQTLAWMSARLAPELGIVGATLIAGWLTAAILRR